MTAIPTPYTVRVRPFLPDAGQDAHGNPVQGWGAPWDWDVHGVYPGASEEPRKPNRDLSVVLFTIYAPPGAMPGERDQISLPWEDDAESGPRWYDIEGRPADHSMNPWKLSIAGVVVELRRPEG